MSTASEREAALRRALLSAAAQIEPAPGGLQRIQARLGRPRPLPVAWLTAAWTALVMRAPDVFEAMRRSGASALRLVVERFGPRSAADAGSQRLSWLRPLAAMSVAVFVLGAAVYLGLAGTGAIFATDSGASGASSNGTTHPGTHPRSGGPSVLGTGSPTAFPGGSGSPSPTCSPPVSRFKAAQPTTGASTPSSTSSASPSDSTSPSTSVTPSTTPDPGSTSPATETGAASPGAASPDAAQASDSASAGGADITGTGASASGRNADPASTHASTASTQSVTRSACGKKKTKHSAKSRTATASMDIGALTSAQFAVTEPGKAAEAMLA